MNMDHSSLINCLVVARAIHFASCLLIAGVWMFDGLVIKDATPAWRQVAMAILLIATPLALASGGVWFLLVAADMSDLQPAMAIHRLDILRLVWLHTQFGRTWQIHFAFWMGGAITAIIWALCGRSKWIGIMLGAGLVAGLAWAGHGSTGPHPGWHLTTDVLHLVAASIWPAGLLPLGLLLPRMVNLNHPDQRIIAAQMIGRFSACSLIAVGLLTLTGLFNSWCLLGSIPALVKTVYGRVLLVKLILFCGMIGIGAVNLLILKPRLVEHGTTLRRLWLNVIIEILLGTAVVAAVGILGLLEPARSLN